MEPWDHGQQRWIGGSTTADLAWVDPTRRHVERDEPDVAIDDISRRLP